MFSTKPVLTIVLIFRRSVPKIIAFGGVAVGNMKASEEAIVAGIIKSMGLFPLETARLAKTGSSICVEATLEVNSVRKDISVTTASRIRYGCMFRVHSNCSPNQSASPED